MPRCWSPRPTDDGDLCTVEAQVFALLPEVNQVRVETAQGFQYAITEDTPGVSLHRLQLGQRLSCTVTRTLPRVVRAQVLPDAVQPKRPRWAGVHFALLLTVLGCAGWLAYAWLARALGAQTAQQVLALSAVSAVPAAIVIAFPDLAWTEKPKKEK